MMKVAVARRLRIAFLAVWLAGCGTQTAPSPPPVPVLFATATAQDTPLYREYIGEVVGAEEVSIRPRVSGILISKGFQDGSFVRQGQTLFVVDPREFQASLAGAEAQLASARALEARAQQDVARYAPLVREDAIPRQLYDNSVQAARASAAQSSAAAAGVRQAQVTLSYAYIRAPISGQIGKASVDVGNLVSPGGGELARISKSNPIWVYFSPSEQDLLEFAKTSPANQAAARSGLRLILADGTEFPEVGQVNFADRSIDPTTGSYRIRATFPNPGLTLKPGQFGRVRLTFEQRAGAIVIPDRAVIDQLGTFFVLVVGKDNKVEQRQIVPGPHLGSTWVIDKGLKAGEPVIVEGIQKAKPGAVVSPKPLPPQPQSVPGTAPASRPG